MQATALFALSAVAAATSIAAVQTPDLETLIQRLGAYVVAYEADVSTIIADEEYRQSETSVQPNKTVAVRRRTLHSETAFLRLPGGREWFGVRNVLRVDGRQVSQADRLADQIIGSTYPQLPRHAHANAIGYVHSLSHNDPKGQSR